MGDEMTNPSARAGPERPTDSGASAPKTTRLGSDVFRLLVENVKDYAIFLLDATGHVLTWNKGAEFLKGYKASEILGKHFSIFYGEEDLRSEKPRRELETAEAEGRVEDEGWRYRKDGTRFWANVVITALYDEDGTLYGFGKVTRDLTSRKAAEEASRKLAEERAARLAAQEARELADELTRRATLLQSVTSAFAEALTPDEAVEVVYTQVLPALGGSGGSLTLFREEDQELELAWTAGYSDELLRPYQRFHLSSNLPHSVAARSRQPLFLETKAAFSARFPELALTHDREMLMVLPLVVGGRLLGVLGTSDKMPRTIPADERAFAMSLAQQCAQALERSRSFEQERLARQRAQESEERLVFLSEASGILGSSLDYLHTLAALTRLAVPRLADWCSIEVVEEKGEFRQIEVAHVDPSKVRLAWELRAKYPPNPNAPQGVREVIRTGKSQLMNDIPDALLVRATQDEEHLSITRELGLKAYICVPLKSGTRVLGALSLVTAESGRRYGAADLAIAEELGARAGLAMENARLYRDAQSAIARRDEFLSVASHELRTPLTSLQLHLSSLLHMLAPAKVATADTEKIRDKVLRADRQGTRLVQLMNQLLDVGRLESDRMVLDRSPTDLGSLTTDVVSRFDGMIESSGSKFSISTKPNLVGSWDRERLDQVITNLISNALRYGRSLPIEVRVFNTDSHAILEVQDHGIGIAPEDQSRIFERFERASSPRNYGGIGLGLWIVREIMDLHGGRVSVESKPTSGSTFRIELPLEQG
jgi:PAS domain S-box-containing protein